MHAAYALVATVVVKAAVKIFTASEGVVWQ